jgi:hypothetical protein
LANQDLPKVKGLISELEGQTLQPLQGHISISNQTWTLKQLTANEGSDFVGRYKLPLIALASSIASVSVTSHTAPSSGSPARYLPPGADPQTGWLDLNSVADLVGKVFNEIIIRSGSAFVFPLKTPI